MTIDERIEQLEAELGACVAKMDTLDLQAEEQRLAIRLLTERIAGLREAQAMIEPKPGNGAKPPRRDIRGMVKAMVARGHELHAEALAAEIGCRPSQVRKALAALEG
jgi:hypothetical protein